MDRREQNGRWYVCKVLLRAGILFLVEGDSFLVSADSVQLIFHFNTSFLFSSVLSQSHQKRT